MNLFKYEDHQLRTIEIEGEPWFHATDVCKCVGLSVSGGTYPQLKYVDADDKQAMPLPAEADYPSLSDYRTPVRFTCVYRLVSSRFAKGS